MSDINDLIHSNAVIAFQQGEKTERNRIIKLVESQLGAYYSDSVTMDDGLKAAIALIKGEQK